MKILLRAIIQKLGAVPPHWELFTTLNPVRFQMFIEEINYLTAHPHIDRDFFAFLRYAVASDNGFAYCIAFNQNFLLSGGYTQAQLDAVDGDAKYLPLGARHQLLFDAVMTAIYTPELFTSEVTKKLNSEGWSDADIFDAVDHGAFLFRFAKVLKAYLV